mmetsp:Transcript_17705/g.41141  ORF Transcript_17705/g.41141 Transcript_17705/m.41141 type:complete len:212 (-) Transcript_17705:268-903(-)
MAAPVVTVQTVRITMATASALWICVSTATSWRRSVIVPITMPMARPVTVVVSARVPRVRRIVMLPVIHIAPTWWWKCSNRCPNCKGLFATYSIHFSNELLKASPHNLGYPRKLDHEVAIVELVVSRNMGACILRQLHKTIAILTDDTLINDGWECDPEGDLARCLSKKFVLATSAAFSLHRTAVDNLVHQAAEGRQHLGCLICMHNDEPQP